MFSEEEVEENLALNLNFPSLKFGEYSNKQEITFYLKEHCFIKNFTQSYFNSFFLGNMEDKLS